MHVSENPNNFNNTGLNKKGHNKLNEFGNGNGGGGGHLLRGTSGQ